jgi:hypothetical protein
MIILSNTTDNLQIVLGGTITTNQLNVVTSWRDITTTDYTAGRTVVNTNNGTDVNIVPAPAASTQRVVDFISVYNADTADATVTIKFDANGTEYVIYKTVLGVGDTLRFIEGAGFSTERTFQPVKSIVVHADAGANFVMTNATLAERFAGNSTRMIFGVDLLGYTQVRLESNKQVIGTAGSLFRAKYFTSFNTTVTNYIQLGLSAQVELSLAATGYGDTGWVNLATAARANSIYIAFTELGGDGVADPALGFTEISFR